MSNFTEPASTPESYQLSMLGAEQFPRSVGFGFGFADLLKQKLSGNQLEQVHKSEGIGNFRLRHTPNSAVPVCGFAGHQQVHGV